MAVNYIQTLWKEYLVEMVDVQCKTITYEILRALQITRIREFTFLAFTRKGKIDVATIYKHT